MNKRVRMREKERGEREALFIHHKDSERNNARANGGIISAIVRTGEIVYSTFIIIYVHRANVVVYEPSGRRGATWAVRPANLTN